MRETNSILGRINDAHPRARKAKCQEKGCRLFLPQTSGIVILKGERLTELPHQDNQPAVCDCFIFDGNDRINVALVELKSASLHEESIRRKFESSARIAKNILRGAGYSASFNLALILLAKRYSSSQKKKLQGIRIGGGAARHRILLRRCGAGLADAAEYEVEHVGTAT